MEIKTDVPLERLECALISALEGGSNYWYMIEAKKEPIAWDYWGDFNKEHTKYAHLYPLNAEGALYITDAQADEPTLKDPVYLDMAKIQAGAQIMASKFPRHWGDLISENDDAETGDVFLQCCVFGDVIYG